MKSFVRSMVVSAILGFAAIVLWHVLVRADTSAPTEIPDGAAHGVVERVVDGDTVHVLTDAGEDLTVRLIGVDTPETVKPDTAVQCFGPEASDFTKQQLPEGEQVWLERDASQGDVDRYGRTLAYLWHTDPTTGDAEILNQQLIARGYGREYTYATDYRYQAAFRAAQDAAESSGAGLWGSCAPGASPNV